MAETHGKAAVHGEAGRQARRRRRLRARRPGEGEGGAWWGRVPESIRRLSVSRYTAALVVALFFGAAAAWVHNAAGHRIQDLHPDEAGTLLRGVEDLAPPPKESDAGAGDAGVEDAGAGGIDRWFARILYPGGVYYLNERMGAGADMSRTRGWEQNKFRYPGGFYLKRHFTSTGAISQDPNVQDFAFFMRTAFNLIAVAGFCLVLWTLSGRFGFPAAAVYGSLVLGGPLVFDRLHGFHAETATFIVFNLAAALYVRYGMSWPHPLSLRMAAWLGVLCAAALSAGPAGAAIAAMPGCMLIAGLWRQRQRQGLRPLPRIEVFLLSFLAFLYLADVPFGDSVLRYFDGATDGVERLAGGRSTGPEGFPLRPPEDGAGVVELPFLPPVPGIGRLVPPLFLAGLLWLASSPRRAMTPAYALGAAVVLVVWSFFPDRTVHPDRNFASLYVAMSFIAAVAAGDLLERLPGKGKKLAAACASPALALALLATGAHLLWQTKPLKEAFFEEIRGHDLSRCGSLAAIGLTEGGVRTLRERTGGEEVAAFPRVPRLFHSNFVNYDGFRKLLFAKYHEYECLVVYREDDTNTKQVTNFFAPKYYELRKRIGDRFFFSVRPPAPADLKAAGADGSIALSWTAPFGPETVRLRSGPMPGGTVRHQFRLKAGGEPWQPWKDVRGNARAQEPNRLVLRDLRNGSDYLVQLRARYPHGFGTPGPAAEVSATPRKRP